MDDSTFHLPIGPQHPFLKEPAKFDFEINGEEIVGARMNIGYNHRGIEKACEARNYYQCLYLLERICGICSHSHTTAFVQAVEEIMNLEVPRRGLYLRTLVCELERLHSHLLWLGVAAHEVGFDSMFMLVWRDRELVMDILPAGTVSITPSTLSAACGATSTTPNAKKSWICSVCSKNGWITMPTSALTNPAS